MRIQIFSLQFHSNGKGVEQQNQQQPQNQMRKIDLGIRL